MPEFTMDFDAIIEVLRWANGNGLPVHLRLRDGHDLVGVPTSVDLHPTAHEVFLHPEHDDTTEIGVALAAILHAELV